MPGGQKERGFGCSASLDGIEKKSLGMKFEGNEKKSGITRCVF